MPPLEIRSLRAGEELEVVKLAERVLGSFHAYFVSKALGRASTLVAAEKGRVVGFITFYPGRLSTLKAGVIYYIAVEPLYQRRGIGSQLLRRAEGRLRHVDLLAASTREENVKAQRFFSKMGYQIISFSDLAERIGWRVADELVKLLYAYEDDLLLLKGVSGEPLQLLKREAAILDLST